MTPNPRRRVSWWATALVAAGTAAAALATRPPPSLAETVRGAVPDSAGGFRAYVVFQAEDCSSNLAFTRVFGRPALRGVALVGVLAGAATEDVGSAFGQTAGRGTVVPVTRRSGRALSVLGFRQTPFLVLVDSTNAVRYAAAAPQGFDEIEALDATLRRLVTPTHSQGDR